MIIHKCDRCKKEFEGGLFSNNQVTTGSLIKTNYELCNDCMKELGNFLRNESVGEIIMKDKIVNIIAYIITFILLAGGMTIISLILIAIIKFLLGLI